MFTVKLMLFGLFRKNIHSDYISFSLNKETNLSEFKEIISREFLKNGEHDKLKSLDESVFANEQEIIFYDFVLDKNITIFILPPVSGG